MLKLTDKHLDTLALANRKSTRLITFEGTIRSSKTVIAIQCFYFRVMNSKEHLHLVAAKDLDAVNDNILDCNGLGLLKLFSKNVKLKKDKVGSYYLSIIGYDKRKKKILLAGYSDIKKWEKILGKTIGCMFVDEVNIANKQFIDECFARQTSADDPFTIWTLNGDTPDHFVYQDYINYGKPLWKVPTSILADMLPVENRKGWYYIHWTMHDNPVMTEEKIENAASIYSKGSYYYIIKILGERGRAEGSIFAQYLDGSEFEEIPTDMNGLSEFKQNQIIYSIGLDLGNNDIKRGTVLTMVAISRKYETVHVLKSYACKATEVNALCDEIIDKIKKWTSYFVLNIRQLQGLWVDSYGAIQLMLETLRKRAEREKLFIKIEPCMKFGDEKGRRGSLEAILMLVAQKRLKFNEESRAVNSSMKKLVYNEKDALPLDENQVEMDYYDSLRYAIAPNIRELTRKEVYVS